MKNVSCRLFGLLMVAVATMVAGCLGPEAVATRQMAVGVPPEWIPNIQSQPEVAVPLISYPQIGDALCVEAVVNGKKGLFILDTGAQVSVLAQDFATTVCKDFKALSPVETNVQSKMQQAHVDTLTVGDYQINDFIVAVIDLSHTNQHLARPIAGLIGYNILRQQPFKVDLYNKVLTLNVKPQPAQTTLALTEMLMASYLTLMVDGKPERFLIDTGLTNHSQIRHERWAELTKGKERLSEKQHVADVNELIEREQIYVKMTVPFEATGKALEPTTFVEGESNMVGMHLLKNYILEFDFKQETLKLNPIEEKDLF